MLCPGFTLTDTSRVQARIFMCLRLLYATKIPHGRSEHIRLNVWGESVIKGTVYYGMNSTGSKVPLVNVRLMIVIVSPP